MDRWHEQMDGWMDRLINEWMDRWHEEMDGWMDSTNFYS